MNGLKRLSGTKDVSQDDFSAGVATFNNLRIRKTGNGYTLTATSQCTASPLRLKNGCSATFSST